MAKKDNIPLPNGMQLVREPKSERIQLLMRPITKKLIKQEAKSKGVSMNDWINTILEEHIYHV